MVIKMKQDELSEAIRTGINKSLDDLGKEFLKSIIIIIIIIIIAAGGINIYHNYKMKKCAAEDNCPEPAATVAVYSDDAIAVRCFITTPEYRREKYFENYFDVYSFMILMEDKHNITDIDCVWW